MFKRLFVFPFSICVWKSNTHNPYKMMKRISNVHRNKTMLQYVVILQAFIYTFVQMLQLEANSPNYQNITGCVYNENLICTHWRLVVLSWGNFHKERPLLSSIFFDNRLHFSLQHFRVTLRSGIFRKCSTGRIQLVHVIRFRKVYFREIISQTSLKLLGWKLFFLNNVEML